MTFKKNEQTIDLYGLFSGDKILGGMRLHHLMMNVYGKMIPVGGVGLVAVDLLHKKEKVAKDLIEYFLQYYVNKNVPIVALYPFRPDFYKNMGFGYGAKIYQYAIEPASFQKGTSKKHIDYITEEDKLLLKECMNRVVKKTHGMIEKTEREVRALFKRPENKVVGYKTKKGIEGYIVFSFKKASDTNFAFNDLVIKEFVYEHREAFLEMSAFLHSQADQFNRVHLSTQEEDFYCALFDPRNETNNLIPVVFHESHKTGV